MEPIRALHMLPDFCLGGAERMALHLMRGLAHSGFDVRALSMYERRGTDIEAELDAARIPVSYLGKSRGIDPRMYYRIHRVMREFQPDIVHTHRYMLRYALPSLLWSGVPAIHTVHNPAEQDGLPRWNWIDRLAYRAGVLPVAISRDVARSLRDVHGVRGVPLIANGIPAAEYAQRAGARDDWRLREGFSEADIVIAAVGRLVWQKNHAALLRAFAQVSRATANPKLAIAGDGPLRHALEAQARSLGLCSTVRFLGARRDVADLLAAADIFVLSSVTEGHPLSLMEAMAAGKACIATAVGGVPEIVDDNTGIVVRAEDDASLAGALRRLLSDRELRIRMGALAIEKASCCFDCSTMVQQYGRLYRDVLERRLCEKPRFLEEAELRESTR